MNIRLIVTDFDSHRTWAEGYQRASSHSVELNFVAPEKWKFRMMAYSMYDCVEETDDIVVVDGMLDVSVMVAQLRSSQNHHTKILVYLHENQFTTPFSSKDRDTKNRTDWHYGMVHWRSLQVADGFILNSQTQFQAFTEALPRALTEQCPQSDIEFYTRRSRELLHEKSTVLHYGLALQELVSLQKHEVIADGDSPVILWNARLEEDKDPAAFLDLLHQIKKVDSNFRLVVLGTDSSKDKKWERRIGEEFSDELLYLGWCRVREDYAYWLRMSSIVVSTAQHETFGISVVESCYAGVIPLLPQRLSYPELYPPEEFPDCYYTDDAAEKLLRLMHMVRSQPDEHKRLREQIQKRTAEFRWDSMRLVYDIFFAQVADGVPINECRTRDGSNENQPSRNTEPHTALPTVVSEATDTRVALYRPRSLRDHREFNNQLASLDGMESTLHGGRRAMVRMLEAIRKGARIRVFSCLTTRTLQNEILRDLIEPSFPVYIAEKRILDEIRGQKLNAGDAILAQISFPASLALANLIQNPPILILENVRNAENIGSILRTAYCLGITSVVASSSAWSALRDSRSARCSMGTMYFDQFYKAESLTETISEIRKAGIRVYGVEISDNAKPVGPHGMDRRWAAVLGNENDGLSRDVADCCDQIVFIPQAHGDSLNVGHAAAIAMFELCRDSPLPSHDGSASCK